MDEIYYWSATRLIEAMKRKQLSAVEVMTTHLERLEKLNPVLNGLVQHFSREACLQKAREADQAIAKGDVKGSLHVSRFFFFSSAVKGSSYSIS